MITLSLESIATGETVNLGAINDGDDEGAEAQPGVTGLGLPPVDTQWSSGAGDGATYRGRRVPPRDVDVPIAFVAESRAGLKAQLKALARVQAGECYLWINDPEDDAITTRVAKVVRVGGGDSSTGVDTDGETYWSTTVTFRAGDPYWVSDETIEGELFGDEVNTKTIDLDNPGTADAFPAWEFEGPTLGARVELTPTAADPTPAVLEYDAFIPAGSIITVDTKTGTVTDERGINRYAGLATAPRFWRIPSGQRSVKVTMDRASTAFLAQANGGVQNFVTNPRMQSDLTGYTGVGINPTYDATNKRAKSAQGYVEYTPADTSQFYNTVDNPKDFTTTVTGLVVGQVYYASCLFAATGSGSPTGLPSAVLHSGMHFFSQSEGYASLVVTSGLNTATGWEYDIDPADGRLSTSFVAGATTATITFRPRAFLVFEGGGSTPRDTPSYYRGWWTRECAFSKVLLSEQPTYFDGSFADDATNDYSWTGSADASPSKKVALLPVDASASRVHVEYNPRDWMVV